jgi:hypothetical protein
MNELTLAPDRPSLAPTRAVRPRARAGLFGLLVAAGLAIAIPAGATVYGVIGGFSGHAAQGQNATCFTESNGGVLQNACSGYPAWEIPLPTDMNTSSIWANVDVLNANGMYCTLTSENSAGDGYTQLAVTAHGNQSQTLAFGPMATEAYSYLFCEMPESAYISGVIWSGAY